MLISRLEVTQHTHTDLEDQSYTSCTGVLLSVARCSTIWHTSAFGEVHNTGLSTDTCAEHVSANT